MSYVTYWVTFDIKYETTSKGTYQARYDALIAALGGVNDGWWSQPTSFILFGSTAPRSEIIRAIKGALDLSTDIAVLGAPAVQVFECIGAVANLDVVQSMVEFAKKV